MAWLLSLKALLMSAGVVSIALALKVAVPLVFEFQIWNSLIACLKPPYIYIIINGIIISVVAAARLNQKESEDSVQIPSEFTEVCEQRDELIVSEMMVTDETDLQIEEVIVPEAKVMEAIRSVEVEAENEDKFVILANPICNPPATKILPEKPLVSSRFGHRKSPKSKPEGGEAKRHETLENTWKAIMEGRAIDGGEINAGEVYSSELNSKRNIQALTAVKEASLSQDDLNRRVEDFISRFNEEMRLQREQSLKKYWEMRNHGGHN